MKKMSSEVEELLESTWKLRHILMNVLPNEAVDHIIDLIVKDLSHRKLLNICDDESSQVS